MEGPLNAGQARAKSGEREAAPGPPNLLLRNNGDGTFTDITSQAKVGGEGGHAVQVVPTDYDNRRDMDLLVVNSEESPILFRNMRDGAFQNVAAEVGLKDARGASTLAAGDVNKDGFTDFFFATWNSPGVFALSDGKGRFQLVAAPEAFNKPSGAHVTDAAQFLDYDNDGLLDLVTLSSCAQDSLLRVWRNVGNGWVDASESALGRVLLGTSNEAVLASTVLASGDVDGDGDTDIFVRTASDELKFLRNDGGNHNASVRVRLAGKVSNRGGVGAKVEARAGSLWQKLEAYAATPAPAPADIRFGLGRRAAADAVRVLWPSGVVQAETGAASDTTGAASGARARVESLKVEELDRKPSSCPFLYTWNGSRFEFVTDFMGGGELGYLGRAGRAKQPGPGRVREDSRRPTERARWSLRTARYE